jgi:hypothetical protein
MISVFQGIDGRDHQGGHRRDTRRGQTESPDQTLAYQALAMLARLFRHGRLSYHGGFVNQRIGHTTALPVDPVVWQRVGGKGLNVRVRKSLPSRHLIYYLKHPGDGIGGAFGKRVVDPRIVGAPGVMSMYGLTLA